MKYLFIVSLLTIASAFDISCEDIRELTGVVCSSIDGNNGKFSCENLRQQMISTCSESSQTEKSNVECEVPPYKYDVIVTATEGHYQSWQTKILWDRLEELRLDPCSPIASMTRLLATSDGNPIAEDDGIHPTVYNKMLDEKITKGFIVINRPWSVKKWFETTETTSPYVLILEPDHLMVKMPPCTASENEALAAEFSYMNGRDIREAIAQYMPGWSLDEALTIPPTGPSPVLIHREQLGKLVNDWYDMSVELQHNEDMQPKLGWVLEMWGFSMAAARNNVKVRVDPNLKIEPPGQTELNDDISIIHYTYGIWYAADGRPLDVWSEKEKKLAVWRFDKRDYYADWPRPMPYPVHKTEYPAAWKYVQLLNHGLLRIKGTTTWMSHALENGAIDSKHLQERIHSMRNPGTQDILLAMSNKNVHSMLRKWANSIIRSNIRYWAVACLDLETYELVRKEYGDNHALAWFGPKEGHGHAVSGAKYALIGAVLKTDTNVLMSDIDVIVFKDPFPTLVKDSDIEGMSDGFNEATAYGYDDVFDDPEMGWSRYAHSFRVFNMNVGWIYAQYSEKTIKLMQRVASRMLKPGVWDQAEFNNELWTPSGPHGDYHAYETWLEEDDRVGLNCAVRIMPFTKVCNSKVWMAHPEYHKDAVVVHFNYHNDKEARMNTLLKERYGIEY